MLMEESDALRTRPKHGVRQGGCWGDPNGATVRPCGYAKPALTGGAANPGHDGTIRFA